MSTINAGECIFHIHEKRRKQLCANALAKGLKAFDFQRRRKTGAKRFTFPQDAGPFQLDISFEQFI